MAEVNRKMVAVALMAAISILLSSCAKAGENMQRASNSIHKEGVKVDRKVRSWFDSEGIGQPEENTRRPDTAFCYKTIGEVTCYSQPLDGQEERLKGMQLPAPPAYVNQDSHLPMHYYQPERTVERVEPLPPLRIKEAPVPKPIPHNAPHELKPQN